MSSGGETPPPRQVIGVCRSGGVDERSECTSADPLPNFKLLSICLMCLAIRSAGLPETRLLLHRQANRNDGPGGA